MAINRNFPNYSKPAKEKTYLHVSAPLHMLPPDARGLVSVTALCKRFFPAFNGPRGVTLNEGRNLMKRKLRAARV